MTLNSKNFCKPSIPAEPTDPIDILTGVLDALVANDFVKRRFKQERGLLERLITRLLLLSASKKQ